VPAAVTSLKQYRGHAKNAEAVEDQIASRWAHTE
jgi:hypothetical protein